jgi:TetR/AcrR family transcriptional regulator
MAAPVSTPESEDKRRLILDAAQKRFAHFGISKSNMEEIAADIGMSKASLYYYFTTKEDIFRAVIIREQEEFIHRMESYLVKDIPPSRKLQEYCLHQLAFINELVNLRILNWQAFVELRPIIGDLFKKFSGEELRLMRSIIAEGQKSGEFDIESPEKYAELIVGLLQGLRFKSIKRQREHLPDSQTHFRMMDAELKLFVQVVLKGIQRPVVSSQRSAVRG